MDQIRGKNAENNVEKYLISNNIPYWKNVVVKCNRKHETEFDFIIPGAIIESKCSIIPERFERQNYQFQKQLGYSKNVILYVYYDQTNTEKLEEIIQYMFLNNAESHRIKFINNLDDIVLPKIDYNFVIYDHSILHGILNDSAYKHKKLFVDTLIYNNTYSIMTKLEEKMLNNCEITLFDKSIQQKYFSYEISLINNAYELTKKPTIVLSGKKYVKSPSITEASQFEFLLNSFIKIVPIDIDFYQKKPNKSIDNYTEFCIYCQLYIFINSKKHKCNKRLKISAE